MLTVAITGGSGFIGGRLVSAHLARGDRVRVLTRRVDGAPTGSQAFRGDLASDVDPAFVDGADVVYHLAAELRDPRRVDAVNAEGTRRLLSTARGRFGRWVQLSSVGVYGRRHAGTVIESTRPEPETPYERSKLAADRAVEAACTDSRTPWGILRPSIVVGADMPNRSLTALVHSVMHGRFAFIGTRGAVATLVHVDDVVDALIAMGRAPSGLVANLSSDCTWEVLVARIHERTGCAMPRTRIPLGLALPLAAIGGLVPGFPLSRSRVRALASEVRYETPVLHQTLGVRPARPMPAGFDDVIDACTREAGRPSPTHP